MIHYWILGHFVATAVVASVNTCHLSENNRHLFLKNRHQTFCSPLQGEGLGGVFTDRIILTPPLTPPLHGRGAAAPSYNGTFAEETLKKALSSLLMKGLH
jgi:hypothetical protein